MDYLAIFCKPNFHFSYNNVAIFRFNLTAHTVWLRVYMRSNGRCCMSYDYLSQNFSHKIRCTWPRLKLTTGIQQIIVLCEILLLPYKNFYK